jgi:signal transduction histidine kinase/CheY-like chemotaxis protein
MNPEKTLWPVLSTLRNVTQLLLYRRTIGVLTLMFVVGIAGVTWVVYRLQSRLIESIALGDAARYADALTEFRAFYTSEVVERVRPYGVEVTHDYLERDGAIPLPATLGILLGNRLMHAESGTVRLYSDYPFPWRQQEGGPRNAFEAEALQRLRQSPDTPVFRFETLGERTTLHYATADRMRPHCVHCHNTHPDSPRTDWQPGDVRGVLALTRPLHTTTARVQTAFERMIAVLAGLPIFALSILALLSVRLRRDNDALQNEIAHRARAEQERRQLEQQMQQVQKLESLGVLAGGIAHDFNNLLTGLLSNASLAQRTLAADHPAQPYLREMAQGMQLASHLTGQLLAYAGKGRFHIRPLDLSAEVRELAALLKTSVQGKAHLICELAPDLPAIEADPVQLHQVLLNLTINAAECMEEEITVRIKTYVTELGTADLRHLVPGSAMQAGRAVVLEVEDNGCGMDTATQERIFDPFFTTKTTGRGLGLAATLGIVHSHGGGIRLDSSPGAGTTFRLFFPAATQPVEAGREAHAQDLSGRGVILVVDDDEHVRQAASAVLQSFGYTVIPADNGYQAVELFRARSDEVDLVLLDMTMPGMSGDETYHALRAIRPDVKVLLSTAYDADEARRQFPTRGPAGFLQKPYHPDQLATRVQQLLAEGGAAPLPASASPDEALSALRAAYRQKLPARLAELTAALGAAQAHGGSEAALRDVHRLVHTLKGTAGSYGFDELAGVLADIEATLQQMLAGNTAGTAEAWARMADALGQARTAVERNTMDPFRQ